MKNYKYTVIASNEIGTASKEISITVTGSTVTPDPTPTPSPTPTPEPEPVVPDESDNSDENTGSDDDNGGNNDPVTPQVQGQEILNMNEEKLKETFENSTNVAITGEVKDLARILEKLETVTIVETLDLSKARIEEVKIPKNSTISSINLSGNTSVKEVDVSGNKNIQTLDLTGSNVTKIEAGGCEKLSEVKVEKAENLTSIVLSETPITSLNVKDCDKLEKIDAKGCEKLEEVILEGCQSLKELNLSETHVTSLNLQDCKNLETLNCNSSSINDLNLEGCENIKVINCSNNSLTRFDAYMFRSLQNLDCGNQHSHGLPKTRGFNILDLLFGRLLANVSVADIDTSETANVKNLRAYDENGKEISVIYDDETGEVTFSQEPAEIKYNYITGFKDTKMDVTVASSSGSKIKNEETEGSGGGCNLIRRNVLIPVLLFLAIALLRKKVRA